MYKKMCYTMEVMKTIEQRFTVVYEYPVVFCRGLFGVENNLLIDLLSRDEMAPSPFRVVIVIDRGVERCHPQLVHQITEWLTAHKDVVELATPIEFLPGNEFVKKHDGVVERLVKLAYQTHVGRKDTFIVIGGGAVQDVVGYAASIVHRGCRILRVNTTTLSQGDAGVGVKNGVDYGSAKNFLGTFAPPLAVVNDASFLHTLTDRDWRNGISEAIKVAVIKDMAFFEWLQANAPALRNRDEGVMEEMIYRSAQLHLAHISGGGDPFERGSARPLDFGHWCAHRLEAMTCYQMSHGEAVAIGIALDMIYASLLDLVTPVEATHVIALLKNCGLSVWCDELVLRGTDDRLTILEGIRQFREHLGGNLCITLPNGLGRKTEIHEMDEALLERAVIILHERHA